MTRKRLATLLFAALLVLVSACGTTEVLVGHSAVAPAGVDFSGLWKIREEDSADLKSIDQAIGQTAGRRQMRTTARDPSRPGGNHDGLVHVFLETGKELKITQTAYAFFVSLDRSIVEEFRFGEQRMINVGEIEAQRVSGWVGDTYVVETLDKHGMKLTDVFWLSENDSVLNREITFRSRKNEVSSVIQLFDKAE